MLDNFYARMGIFVVLLILLPFAFRYHPKLSLGVFLFTFGLWMLAIAPTLVISNPRMLLNNQFLEIMLYIPFSIIGGAGFAGLMEWRPVTSFLRPTLATLFLAGVILSFLPNNSVYPDSCCNYFSESDRAAFRWLEQNSTDHTLVLIPSFDDNGRMKGTDAGVWLFPLLGQPTNKLPFNLDWSSREELESICRLNAGDTYIYQGGRDYSFDHEKLEKEIRAHLVFESGKTKIYQVDGCSK